MNGQDIVELSKVTVGIYVSSARKATRGIIVNWRAVPGSIALLLAFFFISMFLIAPLQSAPTMSLIGGFIMGMISCAMLSIYYLWVQKTVERELLTWNSLFEMSQPLFSRVIQTAFVLWIGTFLLKIFGEGSFSRASSPIGAIGFQTVCWILVVVVFNAISEVVIFRRSFSLDAFSGAAEFLRDNGPEWLIPFFIPTLTFLLRFGFSAAVAVLASTNLQLPSMVMLEVLNSFIHLNIFVGILLIAPLCHWYTLFRAYLFVELDSSSRRKRLYLSRQ